MEWLLYLQELNLTHSLFKQDFQPPFATLVFCSIRTKKDTRWFKKKKKIQSFVGHRKDGRATGNQVLSYNQLKTRKLLGVRPAGFYSLFQDNLSTANVVLVFFLSRTKVSRIAQGRFWHSTSYHVNMPSAVIRLSQVHTSQWLTPWSVGERGDSWSYKGCSLSIEVQFSSSAKRVLQERQQLLHKTAIEGMHVLTYGHVLGNSIGYPKS